MTLKVLFCLLFGVASFRCGVSLSHFLFEFLTVCHIVPIDLTVHAMLL